MFRFNTSFYVMLLLNKHSIAAAIEDRYASVVYSFDFENINQSGSSELKFELTIEREAFISKFEADIDGELFIGETKEKETASTEYTEAKEKHENAILISKPYDDIPNVFEIKTNIDSKSKISLQIAIQQYIKKQFNFNQLNIQILRNFTKYNIIQNVEHISFTIDIKDKSGIYDVNTHANMIIDDQIMDKSKLHFSANGKIPKESSMNELMIKYKIKGEQSDSMVLFDHKSHTFCHILSDIIADSMIQNEEDIDEGQNDDIEHNILIPRRVVFVIDKSGSMSGGKWNRTISATISALKQLRKSYDRYCIVLFNGNTQMIPNEGIISATDDNIQETISHVENMSADGGTNINDALMKAIELIKSDIHSLNESSDDEYMYNLFMNQILLITDGEPNIGERDPNKIISNVKLENNLKSIDKYISKISIFSFGVGSDTNDSSWIKDLNHSFLKSLSLHNNAFYKRIKHSNTDTALMQYFDILSKPVLSNIKIEYKNKNITDITNTTFHTLYAGNDIIICGKIGDYIDHQKRVSLDLTITAITGKEIKNVNDEESITKAIRICKDINMNIDTQNDDEMKENDNIQRIWAYLQLQQFAENKLIHNDLIEVSDDEKKKDDALPLSLAMKYQFVTPWTSMIVVKKKQDTVKKKGKNDDLYYIKYSLKKKGKKQYRVWDSDAQYRPQPVSLQRNWGTAKPNKSSLRVEAPVFQPNSNQMSHPKFVTGRQPFQNPFGSTLGTISQTGADEITSPQHHQADAYNPSIPAANVPPEESYSSSDAFKATEDDKSDEKIKEMQRQVGKDEKEVKQEDVEPKKDGGLADWLISIGFKKKKLALMLHALSELGLDTIQDLESFLVDLYKNSYGNQQKQWIDKIQKDILDGGIKYAQWIRFSIKAQSMIEDKMKQND